MRRRKRKEKGRPLFHRLIFQLGAAFVLWQVCSNCANYFSLAHSLQLRVQQINTEGVAAFKTAMLDLAAANGNPISRDQIRVSILDDLDQVEAAVPFEWKFGLGRFTWKRTSWVSWRAPLWPSDVGRAHGA